MQPTEAESREDPPARTDAFSEPEVPTGDAPDPLVGLFDESDDETLPVEPWLDLEAIDVSDARPYQIHGRVDLTWAYSRGDNAIDEFHRDHLLSLSPGLYASYELLENLLVVVEVEWEDLEHKVEIDRAALQWRTLEQHLIFDFGRQVIPFGLERRYYSPGRNPLVDRPAAFRVVYPGTFSDYGVFASGHIDTPSNIELGFATAITLGLQDAFDRGGETDSLDENNDSPQWTVRGSIRPLPALESLQLGASYLLGSFDVENDLQADFTGVDLEFTLLETTLRAEWVRGHAEREIVDGGEFTREGWYVQLERSWTLGWHLGESGFGLHAVETSLRYDDVEPNSRVRDAQDLRRLSFGLNLVLHEGFRWKLQYEIQDEKRREIHDNNLFFTQIEYHW